MTTLRHPTIGPAWPRLAVLAVILAVLLVAAWFVIDALESNRVEQATVQAPALSAPASVSARPVGMGDVRLFEGQLARQSQPVGMGDVRLFESTQRSER